MKRLFRVYIFFIISTIVVTTIVVATTVVATIVVPTTGVPHNIDYLRSSLAASMYASLLSKISGEAKKSIMGGILAELLVEGLGRASFLPEKLKKGKLFFYKFLVLPTALCWWIKEGYLLFTPQERLEFDSNNQIKKPTQYLFYFYNNIIECRHEWKNVNDEWKFYSRGERSEDEQGKISIETALDSICAIDKTLGNILSKVIENKSIQQFINNFIFSTEVTSIIDSIQEEKSIISNSDKEKIDRNIQDAGKFIKLVTIEIANNNSSLKPDEVVLNLDDCVNNVRNNIDCIIERWRKNFFLDIYYRQQNFNHGKNFYEKWKFARENIRSSLLYKMLLMKSEYMVPLL